QAIVNASWAELINIWNWLVKNVLGGTNSTVNQTPAVPSPWSWDAVNAFSFSWTKPTSCNDLLSWSTFKAWTTSPWDGTKFVDWVYEIDPDWAWAIAPKNLYCDMTSSWGGWSLLFRWWSRNSGYCTSSWFWVASPNNPYSIGTTYLPLWLQKYYRTSINWTTFVNSTTTIAATTDSEDCFVITWTWVQDPTNRDTMKILFYPPWSCYWFYFWWSCADYTNNWWIYVK
ncbi:MAG: hypothetical protein ACD_3C00190G0001, partial [uncultured bacterium (gcode 4)]